MGRWLGDRRQAVDPPHNPIKWRKGGPPILLQRPPLLTIETSYTGAHRAISIGKYRLRCFPWKSATCAWIFIHLEQGKFRFSELSSDSGYIRAACARY